MRNPVGHEAEGVRGVGVDRDVQDGEAGGGGQRAHHAEVDTEHGEGAEFLGVLRSAGPPAAAAAARGGGSPRCTVRAMKEPAASR